MSVGLSPSVSRSVCVFVATVYYVIRVLTEAIDLPLRLVGRVGPTNVVLDWMGSKSPIWEGVFGFSVHS